MTVVMTEKIKEFTRQITATELRNLAVANGVTFNESKRDTYEPVTGHDHSYHGTAEFEYHGRTVRATGFPYNHKTCEMSHIEFRFLDE